MRNYFLLAMSMLALTFAFSSCGEDATYQLEVDNQTLIFAAEGARAQEVKVTAEDTDWSVVAGGAEAEWLHFEKRDGAVNVIVDDNTEPAARTAEFIVRSNAVKSASRTITVSQLGTDSPNINIGVTVSVDLEFGYNGGSKAVTVTTSEGLEWDVEAVEGSDWVTFDKNDGGFTIIVAPTGIVEPREAKVAVKADGIEDVIVTVKQDGRTHIVQDVFTIKGTYWGENPETGQSIYTINLWNEFVQDIGGGWIMYGPGAIMVNIEMYGDAPASAGSPEIPAGTYTVADWQDLGSKSSASVGIQIEAVDGVTGSYNLLAGTQFTLERSGENYKISFDKVLLGGDIFFSTAYDGFIDVLNGNYPTTLTDNIDFGEIAGPGIRVFRGDYAQNGTYMWGNVTCSDDVTMTPEIMVDGTGFLLDFSLFTDKTDDKHIADGTYTIGESLEAGTAYSVYYVELEEGAAIGESVMYKGKVIVSHEGDVYRMEFDAEDIKGNKVKGVWEGDYGFTTRSAPAHSNINAKSYTWEVPSMGTNKVKQANRPRFIK